MRILITVTPRIYREVFALSIHRQRPDFEVLLAPPGSLDGRIGRFWPHVLVQDADDAALPPMLPDGMLCCIQLLDTGRMGATIQLDGTVSEVKDIRLEGLFGVLEKAEGLLKRDGE
ncbi:MAG: hypothetical protein H0U55_10345 [Rubrobacteraceae bacterium]|nr:hypothetical protein [Rubrobacteraceae bacterium]